MAIVQFCMTLGKAVWEGCIQTFVVIAIGVIVAALVVVIILVSVGAYILINFGVPAFLAYVVVVAVLLWLGFRNPAEKKTPPSTPLQPS